MLDVLCTCLQDARLSRDPVDKPLQTQVYEDSNLSRLIGKGADQLDPGVVLRSRETAKVLGESKFAENVESGKRVCEGRVVRS